MTTIRSPLLAIAYGAGAGVVASLAMAAYAVIASLANGTGLLTPLYHIASLVAAPDAMMTSMEKAVAGTAVHFVFGTALVGALIHMTTGAAYGAVIGLVISRLRLRLVQVVPVGLVYGAIVFAASTFVGLPVAAGLFGAGDPIRNMAELAGWGTFVAEHLLFGVTLGLLIGIKRVPADTPTAVNAG